MRRAPLLLLLVVWPGCAQLILFEQPIIGQPDEIPSSQSRSLLCDEEVTLGASAMCDVSCTIEPDGSHGCGDRLRRDGDRLLLDASHLQEIEVTLTSCRPLGSAVTLGALDGGRVRLEGRALAVIDDHGDELESRDTFLPEDDCADRTLIFQEGRVELVEQGDRLCSDRLPRFGQTWAFDRPAHGLDSIELCLRAERSGDRAGGGPSSGAEGGSGSS